MYVLSVKVFVKLNLKIVPLWGLYFMHLLDVLIFEDKNVYPGEHE